MTESPINTFSAGVEVAAEAAGVGSFAEETPPEADHSLYWTHQKKAQEGYNQKAELVAQVQDPTERKRAAEVLMDRAAEASEELEGWYTAQLQSEVDKYEKKLFFTIASERDSVRSAYSDILDRVSFAQMTGEGMGTEERNEALEEIYQRALRTGDRSLQKAAYHYALENGIASVRDRYLSGSEEKSAAWREYNIARRRLDNWQDPLEASGRRMTGYQGFARPSVLR
jgi:hypothetical protein